MPGMTKEQYWEAGRKAAAAKSTPAALKPGTWQHAAYRRGYAGVPLSTSDAQLAQAQTLQGTRKLGKSITQHPKFQEVMTGSRSLHDALEARRRARFAHWPEAAAEHLRRLAEDVVTEKNPHRVERLMRAAGRMTKRYGPPRALDFPVSTQPCPEGPITAGMLLAGR